MVFKLHNSETTQLVNLELRNIMDEMQMPPPASRRRINLTRQNVVEEVTKFQNRTE